jgi:hypothetical protein
MEFIANHTNQDQNQNRNCGQHQNGGPMNVQCLLWKMLDANTTRKTIIDVQNLGTGGDDKQPQDINKQPQDNKTVSFQTGAKNEASDALGIPRRCSNPEDRMTNKIKKKKETAVDLDVTGDAEDETPSEDPEEPNDFEEFTRFINSVKGVSLEQFYETVGHESLMVQAQEEDLDAPGKDELATSMHDGSTNVRAHTEFYDVIAQLVKGRNVTVLTTDNGADTCVVGIGWIVFLSMGQEANLVGFDSNFARKKGSPKNGDRRHCCCCHDGR